MFEKKLSKSIYFSILFLTALVGLLIYLLLNQSPDLSQILGFDKSSGFGYWFMLGFVVLISLVCLSSVFVLLRQVTKFNNTAFTVDNEGIHDTYIGITFFALIIIVPVKLIPWSAVKELKSNEEIFNTGKTHIKVNRKDVIASPVAKLILGIFGFNFCHGQTATPLDEIEKSIITTYCGQSPDCKFFEEENEPISGYSKKAKAGMIILAIINALFLLLTFLDYSSTAEISCIIPSIIAVFFDPGKYPMLAEACGIMENETLICFQVYENYLYHIWTFLKTAHIIATVGLVYLMLQKKPKLTAKKLTLSYILCTLIIATSGMTVLQFAVHNRIEASEKGIIISEYGKEDILVTNYTDAEKVKVYITETRARDGYLSYECAVDVTVKGKTYTFFGTDDTLYEDMEMFINFFDESIVEIDTTYWDTEEFQSFPYESYKKILDRIYKK